MVVDPRVVVDLNANGPAVCLQKPENNGASIVDGVCSGAELPPEGLSVIKRGDVPPLHALPVPRDQTSAGVRVGGARNLSPIGARPNQTPIPAAPGTPAPATVADPASPASPEAAVDNAAAIAAASRDPRVQAALTAAASIPDSEMVKVVGGRAEVDALLGRFVSHPKFGFIAERNDLTQAELARLLADEVWNRRIDAGDGRSAIAIPDNIGFVWRLARTYARTKREEVAHAHATMVGVEIAQEVARGTSRPEAMRRVEGRVEARANELAAWAQRTGGDTETFRAYTESDRAFTRQQVVQGYRSSPVYDRDIYDPSDDPYYSDSELAETREPHYSESPALVAAARSDLTRRIANGHDAMRAAIAGGMAESRYTHAYGVRRHLGEVADARVRMEADLRNGIRQPQRWRTRLG